MDGEKDGSSSSKEQQNLRQELHLCAVNKSFDLLNNKNCESKYGLAVFYFFFVLAAASVTALFVGTTAATWTCFTFTVCMHRCIVTAF